MVIFLVILGVILVAADQAIKIWAVNVLKPVKVMDFIHFGDLEILGLRYTENTGAAFSSFSGTVVPYGIYINNAYCIVYICH